MPNFIEIGQTSLENGGLGHIFFYFVTDGEKRDYLSRDSQCARGATKNYKKNSKYSNSNIQISHAAIHVLRPRRIDSIQQM